jgi:uncharacterized membrane protein
MLSEGGPRRPPASSVRRSTSLARRRWSSPWIAVNAVAVGLRWDPYPFILLNLAFSTQAAYAAPLILLAQTRQVDRDKAASDQLEAHREEVTKRMQAREAALKVETDELKALLEANTKLTQQDKELTERIEALTREIHTRLTAS